MSEETQATEAKAGTSLIQVIDDDSNFCPTLTSILDDWGITPKGFEYHVVAILGCQSSGKSTLLNLLFDTRFAVMDAEKGRSQTTVGIWLGRADNGDTLVLDVEGTDSRERGEEAANYERKTALFSLALAEILIVNLWHTDIGRYNAANYSLLKNVFELNLQLFGKARKGKTLMLFVIRDHVSTPMDKLEALVRQDMVKIWSQLQKPSELVDAQVDEFFDFAFKTLPHKEFQPENFYAEVKNLKHQFNEPSNPDYLWKDSYTTDVPADGWAAFASSVWETIKSNKDLDLPSQKEMLAMYRCDEILEQALRDFNAKIEPLRKQLSREPLSKFGETASNLLRVALAQYDGPASRYHAEVAARKRESLKGILLRDLHDLFQAQLSRLREEAISTFDKNLEEEIPADSKKSIPNFGAILNRITSEVVDRFEKQVQESKIEEAKDWDDEQERQLLTDSLTSKFSQARQNQLALFMNELNETLNLTLAGPVSKQLDLASATTWPRIRELYETAQKTSQAELTSRLNELKLSEQEVKKYQKKLEESLLDTVREQLKNRVNNILSKLERRFEENFSLDHNQLPRRWEATDDISEICNAAKQKALKLLDTYCILRLTPAYDSVTFAELAGDTPPSIEPSLITITPTKGDEIKEQFNKQTQSYYVKAMNDQEHAAQKGNLPKFLLLLTFLLGFNEMLYVFGTIWNSPILTMLIILIAGGIYVAYSLGLLTVLAPLSGPALELLKNSGINAVTGALNKLKGPDDAASSAGKKKND